MVDDSKTVALASSLLLLLIYGPVLVNAQLTTVTPHMLECITKYAGTGNVSKIENFIQGPANRQTGFSTFTGPKGRFTILYPSNWTATPQTDRFQTALVKFDGGAAVKAGIAVISLGATDPEAQAREIVNSGLFGYTLFQDVECSKYKVDGQEACSYIYTKQADPDLGTQGMVMMGVVSYVKGQMYGMGFGAPESLFDQIPLTFNTMIYSLKFSGSSSSGSTNSTLSQ